MKKPAFKPCRACAKTTPKQNSKSLRYNKADGTGVDLEGMTPTEYINKVFDKFMIHFGDDNDANSLSVSKVINYTITPQQLLDLHLTAVFVTPEELEGITIVGRDPLDVLNDLMLKNPRPAYSNTKGIPSKCKCESVDDYGQNCDCVDTWGLISCAGKCAVPVGGQTIDGVNIAYGCITGVPGGC